MTDVKKPFIPMLYVRSTIYWIFSILALIPVVASELLFTLPFSVHVRYKVASSWAKINMYLLKWICNLDYKVEGLENVPQGGAIIMAKHQSTWETMAMQAFLPPQIWVLKKELMRVPVFGWGLAMLKPIAIDRSAGRKAVEQMVEQGRERLAEGRWVVIFPEGTRVKPGVKQRYKMGGAILASKVDYPIVPVAHNAGEFWPRHSYIKWPGTITVRIGTVIHAFGREPEDINKEVETWIESQMKEISDPARWNR